MGDGRNDDRHILVGAAVAACLGLLVMSAVQAVLPGTQRDLYALALMHEVNVLGPERVAEWLCTTEIGRQFRETARDVLAYRGVDSRRFCDGRS